MLVNQLLEMLNQIPPALVVKSIDLFLKNILQEELLVKPSHYNASQIKRLTEAQEAQKVEADDTILVAVMIESLNSKLKHISMIATGSRL
jgi:hypothetical protein